MPQHLTAAELDWVQQEVRKGSSPTQIQAALNKKRARRGAVAPHVTNIRKIINGKTYSRRRVETRGRKRTYSRAHVNAMNKARKQLLKEAKGEREVPWRKVCARARAPKANRCTILNAFRNQGIPVQARRPRQKPARSPEQAKQRKTYCEK